MDRTNSSDVIRKGATRAELYNEGLLVYLYDEKNRPTLIEQNAHELLHAGFGGDAKQKLAPLSNSHVVVAYELRQDDSIRVDVTVGPPLTKDEMKPIPGLKWCRQQKAVLSLPSGQLRIETPNSCRFARGEEPQEAGASIPVPAGQYCLTLYRIDVDETDDAVRERYFGEYKGPMEVVVLTPLPAAKRPRPASAILEYPVRKQKLTWVGNYTISGQGGECLINFWDYWELYKLNLDRAAASALKMEPGSVLEIRAAAGKFTLVYLEGIEFGLGHLGAYQTIFGNERMTPAISALPEVAFACFHKQEEASTEILCCMRIKTAQIVDKRFHGKWRKAKMQLLPEKLELVDRASFGQWRLEQGALHGEVLFRTPYYISMNFDAAALEALGAKVGGILRLRVGGQTATLRVLENVKQFLESSKARGWQEDGQWEKLKERFTFAATEEEKEKVRQEMRQFLLHDTPLFGYLDAHWYDRGQKIFLAHPSAKESGFFKFNFQHGLPAEPGTRVVLEKA
jgi:hypothetical protein